MPIFEYLCGKCGNKFEELVFSSDKKIKCPECGSAKVEKLFSTFASASCSGCDSGSGHT